jgi:hypothetical protein
MKLELLFQTICLICRENGKHTFFAGSLAKSSWLDLQFMLLHTTSSTMQMWVLGQSLFTVTDWNTWTYCSCFFVNGLRKDIDCLTTHVTVATYCICVDGVVHSCSCALNFVEWLASCLGCITPWTSLQSLFGKELDGCLDQSRWCGKEKNLCSLGIESQFHWHPAHC